MKMIVRNKKKRSNILLKLLVIIIIGVMCAFLLIRYYSNNISPVFMVYAEDEIRRIISIVVNDSINNEYIDKLDNDNIFEIVRSNNGDIQLVNYNTKNVNSLLNEISLIIQEKLKLLEIGDINKLEISDSVLSNYDINLLKNGIVCEIPFGAFSKSSLISNVGPKIPVKFKLLGDVNTGIDTVIKEYGINNAFLEVYIEVSVNVRVHLPFISDKIVVSDRMPISMKIIQGNIPEYYAGSIRSTFGIVDK